MPHGLVGTARLGRTGRERSGKAKRAGGPRPARKGRLEDVRKALLCTREASLRVDIWHQRMRLTQEQLVALIRQGALAQRLGRNARGKQQAGP
jgi:hypothetical protein